ncbi:MAG: tetratricopeptide repeat protein, partial [Phormidesmis sp.]
ISLSLVYLELANRLQFPMVGVGMPGHFLVRPVIGEMEVFVDPFNQGEVLFVADCKERFHQIYPASEWQTSFLNGVLPRHFLARMLMNLKMIYLQMEDLGKAIATLDKLLILMPEQPLQMRDRGLLHYELKNYDLAKQDLEEYLRSQPQAPDGRKIQQILNAIRSS